VANTTTHRAQTPSALAKCIVRIAPDLVIHLAAPVSLDRDPSAMGPLWEGIFDTTDAVARACLQADIRLVVAGTCEEYGNGPAPFGEGQAPQPVSPYSTAKAAATHWVLCLARSRGLRATVVRPFLTYGPDQTAKRLIPSAIERALAGAEFPMTQGTQTREFNHVSDVVRGILAARAAIARGRILNIGGGPELPVLEMVQRVYQGCGADPKLIQAGALPPRGGETRRFVGDHSLARELLGHRPKVSLDAGLAETIAAGRARAAH
jgi:nucleoside-diphosphate-sugar epimerase